MGGLRQEEVSGVEPVPNRKYADQMFCCGDPDEGAATGTTTTTAYKPSE